MVFLFERYNSTKKYQVENTVVRTN